MQKRFELLVRDQKLVGDLYLPVGFEKPYSVMIRTHGLTTNRRGRGGKWPEIAQRFLQEGMAVIVFDHRGAIDGESEGKFEDTTLTGRAEDLKAVVEYSKTIPEINLNKIFLLGSSLGGLTALLVTSRIESIKGLILLSTSFNFPKPSEEMIKAFNELGFYQLPTGEKITKGLYEDLQRYNIKEMCQKIKCPTLILHGCLDQLFPRHQAHLLKAHLSNTECQLIEIEGADHAFTDQLNEVLDSILDWLKKLLGKEV